MTGQCRIPERIELPGVIHRHRRRHISTEDLDEVHKSSWKRCSAQRAVTILLTVAMLLMVGCAREPVRRPDTEPAPPTREPAPRREPQPPPAPPRERDSKPAVIALIDRADSLDRQGKQSEAASQLDRALRLDPRDARLLQRRAELFLEMDQPAQAENYALKSFQLSVKHGPLCRRNWETISRARRAQGNRSGSTAALQQKSAC